MNIGNNIKSFRNKKGLTQKELAKNIGVTDITIQNYENNRREPKIETLDKIASILGVTIDDLVKGTEEKAFADALFNGDIDFARDNSITEEEKAFRIDELITRFSGINANSPCKETYETKKYFNLIHDIVISNFDAPIRTFYDFFDTITKKEFENIKGLIEAIVTERIQQISEGKIKKR